MQRCLLQTSSLSMFGRLREMQIRGPHTALDPALSFLSLRSENHSTELRRPAKPPACLSPKETAASLQFSHFEGEHTRSNGLPREGTDAFSSGPVSVHGPVLTFSEALQPARMRDSHSPWLWLPEEDHTTLVKAAHNLQPPVHDPQ